jgi:hypothetical protein
VVCGTGLLCSENALACGPKTCLGSLICVPGACPTGGLCISVQSRVLGNETAGSGVSSSGGATGASALLLGAVEVRCLLNTYCLLCLTPLTSFWTSTYTAISARHIKRWMERTKQFYWVIGSLPLDVDRDRWARHFWYNFESKLRVKGSFCLKLLEAGVGVRLEVELFYDDFPALAEQSGYIALISISTSLNPPFRHSGTRTMQY